MTDELSTASDQKKPSTKRLLGLDVARAIALFGMVAVHVFPVVGEDGSSTLAGEMFAGRASALFAVLAGISLVLLSYTPQISQHKNTESDRKRIFDRQLPRDKVVKIIARAILIGLIGLFVAFLPSYAAVILFHYGILFLIGMLFLRFSTKVLAVLTAAWLIIAPILYYLINSSMYVLNDAGEIISRPESLGHSVTMLDFADPVLLITDLVVTGHYPLMIWIVYILVGILLGRIIVSLRNNSRSVSALWTMFASGGVLTVITLSVHYLVKYSTSVVSDVASLTEWSAERSSAYLNVSGNSLPSVLNPEWFLLATAHTGSHGELLQNIGVAVMIISGALLLFRLLPSASAVVLTPFAFIGSIPLSMYVFHLGVLAVLRLDGGNLSQFSFFGADLSDGTVMVLFVLIFVSYGLVRSMGASHSRGTKSGPLESLVTQSSSSAQEFFAKDPGNK